MILNDSELGTYIKTPDYFLKEIYIFEFETWRGITMYWSSFSSLESACRPRQGERGSTCVIADTPKEFCPLLIVMSGIKALLTPFVILQSNKKLMYAR